ncbi:uncharacterized protein LOC111321833 isoform X2 [Stylophora pistillata]|uniref:uncharacterized protein LOC111321833 isoform X2 n=1 Tax=Stylophora pistillata TaxID=50429 RepID=UPI000C054BD6|nr:uncharacterized protein LOC111321833 isoform X2 [Stylophora pistillata]
MAECQATSSCLSFCTLEERKADGKILYYEIFEWKIKHAPSGIHHFSDASLDQQMRRDLNTWIRNIDERTSCQRLQILFSFSVPCEAALELIIGLKVSIISAGAKGDPRILCDYEDRALLLSWPDHAEDCPFSLDCLKYYKGKTIIHIGELFGETLSSNPWGQTTSRAFQLRLGETFRCVSRVQLPNWPGHMDSLTVWSRAPDVVDCEGADMIFIPLENPRYFGGEVLDDICTSL